MMLLLRAAAGVIVRAECLWEQVLPFINRWQVTVSGKYSRPPPPPCALFARIGVFRGRAPVTVCVPTQCSAQCLFLVTVHSGVRNFCSHFTHLCHWKKARKKCSKICATEKLNKVVLLSAEGHRTVTITVAGQSLEFILPPSLHLLEESAIISLFGLQGITGPVAHFTFTSPVSN